MSADGNFVSDDGWQFGLSPLDEKSESCPQQRDPAVEPVGGGAPSQLVEGGADPAAQGARQVGGEPGEGGRKRREQSPP